LHRRRTQVPDSIQMPRRWPGRLALTLIVVSAAIVLVCRGTVRQPNPAVVSGASQLETDFKRYHDKDFRVMRVVDGDTLDIDAPDGGKSRTRIRLWGVDTPEIAHGGKPDRYFGPEAARFAHDTLDGRTVHVVLSPLDTRGKYGRLLAYIMLERGGVMFNELLIEKGYAYADTRFPHHYMKPFKQAEKRARRAGVGLWAKVTPDDMPAWRRRLER